MASGPWSVCIFAKSFLFSMISPVPFMTHLSLGISIPVRGVTICVLYGDTYLPQTQTQLLSSSLIMWLACPVGLDKRESATLSFQAILILGLFLKIPILLTFHLPTVGHSVLLSALFSSTVCSPLLRPWYYPLRLVCTTLTVIKLISLSQIIFLPLSVLSTPTQPKFHISSKWAFCNKTPIVLLFNIDPWQMTYFLSWLFPICLT